MGKLLTIKERLLILLFLFVKSNDKFNLEQELKLFLSNDLCLLFFLVKLIVSFTFLFFIILT